ncbi:MAG: LacI family DNA-binding transcriptional regulator [Rhodospirillales bacterium]|nr:LacI family DNA-binding transcriptional regulator [Rhodospirillales bacterium]
MPKNQTSKKLTIYDIAKRADVSAPTVSLVLNGKWQSQRISKDTANRVLEICREAGYQINLRARALRLNRSGLAGMIVPQYRNRFFAGLAETFESETRSRGLCPVVVSTQRQADVEMDVIDKLLAQKIEYLFIVGVNHPEHLNEMCRREKIKCVNVDLPGPGLSVVTDSHQGAFVLAERLVANMSGDAERPENRLYFIGGIADDYQTSNRVSGFTDALKKHGLLFSADQVQTYDYEIDASERVIKDLRDRLGRLPHGLFINSLTVLEGVVRFLKQLPPSEYADIVVGCFDWDPFASFLPLPIIMVRQDIETLISEAYRLIDDDTPPDELFIKVPPQLIEF